jgi:hypothetical protein
MSDDIERNNFLASLEQYIEAKVLALTEEQEGHDRVAGDARERADALRNDLDVQLDLLLSR